MSGQDSTRPRRAFDAQPRTAGGDTAPRALKCAIGLCVLAAVAGGGADAPPTTSQRQTHTEGAKPMRRLSRKVDRVIDCHTHFRKFTWLDHMMKIRRHVGADAMNIVCIVNPSDGAGNSRGLYAKVVGKGAFYCFGGLDHSTYKSRGRVRAPSFPDQVDHMIAAGFDGVKLIEGKPSVRRDWYPFPPDGDYYRDFFAHAEKRDVPIVWHVADPDVLWDPVEARKATRERDWIYGPEHPSRDQLYDEVEHVLTRHPKLRVILAHFFFLAEDLKRLDEFLTRHPNAHLDMALGWSLLFYLSDNPARSRDFFLKHQDRILYGTDTSDRNALSLAADKAESIRRFLETDDVFTISRRGPRARKQLRGIALPVKVLEKIFAGNFERIAGKKPRPVKLERAIEYSRRCAKITAARSGLPIEQTVPGQCLAAFQERLKKR